MGSIADKSKRKYSESNIVINVIDLLNDHLTLQRNSQLVNDADSTFYYY